MKFLVVAALCLSMAVFATANDINAGERQDGDVLVATRRLLRPAVPGKPMVAQTGFNSDGEITAVKAVNAPGSNANVAIVKGGPGQRGVVVAAISAPGTGLDVQVDIYANEPPSTKAPASP